MAIISMKQLLEAGVHFGHQTRRWNPKMAPYIFTERNGIYIIDLQKTVKKVDEAYNFIREVAAAGENILFVGTKKQAQEAMKEEAMKEEFDYSRLLGKIVEKFNTREKFATAMNLSADSISDKLNNKTIWKQSDIDKATYLLNIDTTEIGLYFFTKKVRI